jgi:hypothetical protein
MIIISDLHHSPIQEVTKPAAATVVGGGLFPDININVDIDVAAIVQINAFTNNTNNYANVKF